MTDRTLAGIVVAIVLLPFVVIMGQLLVLAGRGIAGDLTERRRRNRRHTPPRMVLLTDVELRKRERDAFRRRIDAARLDDSFIRPRRSVGVRRGR